MADTVLVGAVQFALPNALYWVRTDGARDLGRYVVYPVGNAERICRLLPDHRSHCSRLAADGRSEETAPTEGVNSGDMSTPPGVDI